MIYFSPENSERQSLSFLGTGIRVEAIVATEAIFTINGLSGRRIDLHGAEAIAFLAIDANVFVSLDLGYSQHPIDEVVASFLETHVLAEELRNKQRDK